MLRLDMMAFSASFMMWTPLRRRRCGTGWPPTGVASQDRRRPDEQGVLEADALQPRHLARHARGAAQVGRRADIEVVQVHAGQHPLWTGWAYAFHKALRALAGLVGAMSPSAIRTRRAASSSAALRVRIAEGRE